MRDRSATTRTPVHILAAGGVAAAARSVSSAPPCSADALVADAQPVALRKLVGEFAPQVSRMASRFSQLAALGAADCIRRLEQPLPAGTRVYLATGLGDVAHTDALYYSVMPPQGEMPQPARFATSGNNMAAFFVAQHAGLESRNLTLSQAELSVECALEIALSDLDCGATHSALLGGVDETTLPRDFYTRRFHVEANQAIGEGSGWLVLDNSPERSAESARATLLGSRVIPAPVSAQSPAWTTQTRHEVEMLLSQSDRRTPLRLMTGTGIDPFSRDALLAEMRERWPSCDSLDYLNWTGRFPTAVAIGIARAIADAPPATGPRQVFVHANRDRAGRTGVIVFAML